MLFSTLWYRSLFIELLPWGKTENEIQDGGCVINDRTADVIGRQLPSDVVSNLQQETILTLLISILVPGKIIDQKG